ncbi:DNA-directed RNA polymerase sigma-70 factor [Rhizocola hellebori]|uniref:DNA-directed RNA polymerase sigma-70 factor n=1 Tax=Rhizocola hellebori TaxID=1392758 RepID=A0A8J3VFG4_9ACTN|nr:SigE family RNA polymerase sigma factor [Rhizocola hellebori]GIH04181.1 DNA-directed RNA polymerase sigma-70 factor [Rhizocola hellebori]
MLDDDDGFREFVRARLGPLSRVAYLLTGDHHGAEDLLQSALIKLAGRWKRLAAEGYPEAYLRKVLYHEHVSAWRSRARRPEVSILPLADRAAHTDEAADVVRRLVLRQALDKLTRKQRAVLVLRFFEDLSEADTAQALGCSVGTVKSQTSYALGRLRVVAPELAQLMEEKALR